MLRLPRIFMHNVLRLDKLPLFSDYFHPVRATSFGFISSQFDVRERVPAVGVPKFGTPFLLTPVV